MSKSEITKYWFNSSAEDWKTAESLIKSKRYMHALFFCHLVLEKILKGMISDLGASVPITHDLLLLVEKTNLKINDVDAQLLSDVNGFNIRARYDDYKNSFYKKATASYAKNYFDKVKKFKLWLKK